MRAKLQDVEARWDDVRIFLAAYRYKSLGAAAAHLDLDTSTVSRRLRVLESSMRVRLFDRTQDGISPTLAAERAVAAAEAMEAAHGRLSREASEVEAQAEGVVRLSVAPGMADAFVAPMLARLRAIHPKIHVELDASTQPRDLTRYEADLALRSVRPQGADLLTTKIGSSRWIVAGAKSLASRLGRLSSWGDAAWIAWDRDLATFAPARWLAQYAPKAEVVLRTSHFASQLAAAQSGLGVLLVPVPYARLKKLHAVDYEEGLAADAEALPTATLWLVGHRALREIPRVSVVWNFLHEGMRRTHRSVISGKTSRALRADLERMEPSDHRTMSGSIHAAARDKR